MIDLFMDLEKDKEFHLKMLIAGLKNELENALGTVEQLNIQRQIDAAELELSELKDN